MPLPFVLAAPAHALPIVAPFAAVAVDAQRHRLFAAGVRSVAILDAVTGRVAATIRIGGVRNLAVEPLGGHVFAGTADGQISELDPDRKTVVRSMDAGGATGAFFYDSTSGRLYAGDAKGGGLDVFDMRGFSRLATVPLSGTVQAKPAPDPITRELYVALADRPEIAIVDQRLDAVRAGFPAPGSLGHRSVHFDDALGQIVVIAVDGTLDVYDRTGTHRWSTAVPPGIDACDLDTGDHVLACTGTAGLTFVQLVHEAAPQVLGTAPVSGPAFAAIDTVTHDVLAVRSDSGGTNADFERFSTTPPQPRSSASPH